MKFIFRAFACALSVALSCAGCGDSASGGALPAAPDQILIIADLSTSLTDKQRRSIAGLVAGFVLQAGRNAEVAVYPLVSDMGHVLPLAPRTRPPRTGRLVDIVDWQNYIEGTWAQTLAASIEEVLKMPRRTQDQLYNSCYIASATYANQYFSKMSSVGRLRLVWIGDLIEDCGLAEYRQYRAPNKGSPEKVAKISPGLKGLGSVDVICAILPRELSSGPSDISFGATIAYWDVLKMRLGMNPGLVRIGEAGTVLPPAIRVQVSTRPIN